MIGRTMDRFDRYWIGILVGLILPAVFMVIYVDVMNLWFVLDIFRLRASTVLSKLLMVSVFPDMALIFLFYTTDTWRLSKGVVIGMMPYVLASLAVAL
ncbi:MAG: hypothetical protein IKQ11_00195 [Paludibacteraceae bacterium]|nr:hypothetical protein [Paludibacteraceae bacterium]